MNILVFLAGVSVGWAADKLYNSYVAKKVHADEGNETLEAEEKEITVENTNKEKTKAEKSETEKKSLAEKESLTRKESLTKKESLEEIHDDLSQLKGVGPKLAEALDVIGIYNYEQLSKPSVDVLLERLQKTGGRFSRSVISLIVERAKQAAEER